MSESGLRDVPSGYLGMLDIMGMWVLYVFIGLCIYDSDI